MNSAMLDYLQKNTGYSEPTVSNVVEGFLKFIQVSLRQGNEVKIEKFGNFYTKDLPERQGRNPRTGEEITIAAKRKPDFKFSKTFIESIQPDGAIETPETLKPALEMPTGEYTPSPEYVQALNQLGVRKTPPPVPNSLIGSNKPWFVSINGQTQEFMERDLPSVATSETPVWSEETGWRFVKDIPALSYLFNKAA
ncbi:HU family DNA-binding protein [Aerosakkonema sp. BLCC-F183]|uniref:HU family DNA-binding protein n=1 Tax=Aerosakkonema sp. BLCC-F183 TaxID=3342834 RepID=UPI0035B92AEE